MEPSNPDTTARSSTTLRCVEPLNSSYEFGYESGAELVRQLDAIADPTWLNLVRTVGADLGQRFAEVVG
ncbi:hypothetical protein JMUB5695_04401 [Mycobacterium heckeshornense]|nr:hypothetical protein JMUB5695_04401 [Mycobacterium heckeshornense]